MKNTIFFDDSFSPVLLENEESDSGELQNTIYLRFRTSEATNQKLYITVRNSEHEEDLEPSTEYNYQLAGVFWASGNVTKLQLKNDDMVSAFTQITFPEIISTDAALLEDSGFDFAFYMQGKENKEEELRQQVITYTNGREYNVTPDEPMTKIIEIKFASVLENTQGLFNATINLAASEIEEAGDVTFRIRVNRIFDEVFIPVQTVRDGRYIITISYPVRDILQNDRNQIDVYMTTSAGNIQIEQGQIRASVTASGLSSSSAFTGEIECLELVDSIIIPDAYAAIIPIADSASVSVSSNGLPASITEILGPAVLQAEWVTISPIEEAPVIGRVVLYYTINTENAADYTYNRGYVAIISDSFVLNQEYPSASTYETIDTGAMKQCACDVTEITPSAISVVTSGEDESDDYYMLISGSNGEDESVYSIDSAEMRRMYVQLPCKQNLNGYSKPWLGGTGKNICPNILTTQDISGVTFTVYDDGSVRCTGKATALISKNITDDNHPLKLKASAKYFMSGCPQGGGGSSFQTRVCTTPTGMVFVADDTGSGNAFTVSADGDYGFRLIVRNGYEFPTGGLLFKPMVEDINIFKIDYLTASGITLNAYGEASGTAQKFTAAFRSQNGGISKLPLENARYTISFDAYTDGVNEPTKNGLIVGFHYTDDTNSYINCPNSTTEYTNFTATSNGSKTIESVFISHSYGGQNVWYLKNIRVQKYTPTASDYEPYENICILEGYTTVTAQKDYEGQWHPTTWTAALTNGVNLFDRTGETVGRFLNKSGVTSTGAAWAYSDFIDVQPSTDYIFNDSLASGTSNASHWYFDSEKNYIGYTLSKTNSRFKTPNNCAYMKFSYHKDVTNPFLMTNSGIVYGGEVEAVNKWLSVRSAIVDLGDESWSETTTAGIFRTQTVADAQAPSDSEERCKDIVCSCFPPSSAGHYGASIGNSYSMDNHSIIRVNKYLYIRCDEYAGDVTAFKAAMAGQKAVYLIEYIPDYSVGPSGSSGMDLKPDVVNTYTNNLNNNMVIWNGGMRVEGTEISIDASIPVIRWLDYLEDLEGDTFEYYGFTDASLLEDAKASIFSLGNFSIMRWTDDDSETQSSMVVTITGLPFPQEILTPEFSITNAHVTGIELTTVDTAGNPQVAVKFDSGPWEYYDFTDEAWETVGTGTIGHMTAADLENITESIWAEKFVGASTMQTKMTLFSASDAIEMIQYKFLQEQEQEEE